MHCEDFLWRGLEWYNEELIIFWWRSGSSKMSKWATYTVIVVAWPDRGAGNDPEASRLAFHSRFPISQIDSPLYSGQYGTMFSLGQGGLRCLSALSSLSLSFSLCFTLSFIKHLKCFKTTKCPCNTRAKASTFLMPLANIQIENLFN